MELGIKYRIGQLTPPPRWCRARKTWTIPSAADLVSLITVSEGVDRGLLLIVHTRNFEPVRRSQRRRAIFLGSGGPHRTN